MLYSLTIHNFYSHRHSEFKFAEGTNVLIGLSDSGKSSVLKALNWVFFNTPSGNSFQRWGTDETWVEVVFCDNEIKHTIRRELVKGKNVYYMDNYAPFKAFGTTVPEEIQKVLNINSVNVQSQISPHFLLSNTPGEVARHFNRVARLDDIDKATTNINSWVDGIKQSIRHKENDLKENIKKLTSFKYLVKLEVDLEVLEDMAAQENGMRSNFKQLTKLTDKISGVSDEIKRYSKVLEMETPINRIIDLISTKKELEMRYTKLKKFTHFIENIQTEINTQEHMLLACPLIDAILELHNTVREKTQSINRLGSLVGSISDKKSEVDRSINSFDRLHKQLDDNMPNKCPFCEKPLK
jgi:DNA repair protein SbcC/Rad50